MTAVDVFWRKCSACKKNLAYESKYYECSVSTCSRKRTGYVFCSVPCWETHVPGAGHRDAGAIEKRSPTVAEWTRELNGEAAPKRILVQNTSTMGHVSALNSINNPVSSSMEHEVLIVVSKVKQYIKDKSDYNTSADINDVLSQMIRRACDEAIVHARADGRKTVMARDFKK